MGSAGPTIPGSFGAVRVIGDERTGASRGDTARRRIKAIVLGGPFPADNDHIPALSRTLDLTLYGSLKTLGYEAFAPAPPKQGRARTFRPIVAFKKRSILWVYPGLSRALTADDPDVLHVISEPWGMLAVQAARWARRHPRTALVVHGCDQLWWHGPVVEQKARKRLARYTLTRTDGFAGENSEAIIKARENGLAPDVPTAKIHTNPRNPEVFRPAADPSEKRAVRRALGLPEGGTGIGFVGKLVPEKGPLLLLEAFARARSDLGPETWVAFAGEGRLRDKLAGAAGATDVHVVGRLSYPEQVSALMRAVDIMAVPSYDTPGWREQGPRVVIEAMLSGCALVGSEGGAIPEMMDGIGLVVPQREVEPLAAALVETKRLLPEGLGQRARAQGLATYSGEAVADRLVGLWRKGLAVRAAR